MAVILNIETSAEFCSVTLAENGKIIDSLTEKEERSHASLLAISIEKILKTNNTPVQKIDAIAISKGPGSYTGLRIGTSTAKGMCYGLNIPLIAVDTLKSMSFGARQKWLANNSNENVSFCPMIDARRMEVYFGVYDRNGSQIEPVAAKIIIEKSFEDLFINNTILFCGNGAEKCKVVLMHENALFAGPEKSSAKFMIGLAEAHFKNMVFEDVAYFEPFYLKDFIATTPKNKVL